MPILRRSTAAKRGRMPRPVEPRGIQLSYLVKLKAILGAAHKLVQERLVAKLSDFVDRHETQHRTDAAQHPGKRVNTILDGIANTLADKFSQARLERIASQVATAVSEHQKTQLFRQVKAAIGVDLTTILTPKLGALVRRFTAENVALIRSLPRDYLADVEKITLAGMRAGDRHEDIAASISDRLDVAESRAKLISRDQTLKFFGELNAVRQQALGAEQYIWRTVEDERVRSVHAERDGKTYSWDDPPGDPEDPATGGHPGAAINCRCWAEPIFPEEET